MANQVRMNCNMSLVEGIPADTTVFDPTSYCSGGCIIDAGSQSTIFAQNFRIDAHVIKTSKILDREAMVLQSTAPEPVVFIVTIINTDASYIIQLRIHIIDINDNVPTFIQGNGINYTFPIQESQTVNRDLHLFRAIDNDEGPNGTSSYVLIDPSDPPYFNITLQTTAPSSVELKNLFPLDRELNDSFTFTLIAYEGTENPRNDTLHVTINIVDIDDNIAIFTPSEYTSSPFESVPLNTTITKVIAHDEDEGSNAVIEYTIKRVCGKQTESSHCNDISSPFILDSETGELTLSHHLDYETIVEYRVNIEAHNPNVNNGGTSTALVTVTVQDINDNPPRVIHLPSSHDLSESSVVGLSVLQFEVFDPDSPQFSQSNVMLLDATTRQNSTTFGLQPSPPTFISIIQLKKVDREMRNNYSLIVYAEDKLNTSLYIEVPFNIIITDTNDNPPVFDQPPDPVLVPEKTASGVIVLTLNATDADIGSNAEITYSIPESGTPFFIQTNTGKLLVQGNLDREAVDSYQLVVRAVDNGSPQRSAEITLNITITDLNDNPAVINSTVLPQIQVSEMTSVGSELFDVDAYDEDIPPNNIIMYSLVSDISPLPFEIDANGRVTVSEVLDRDIEPSIYHIRVVVTDGVNQPDSRNFTIILTDVNDNNPEFTQTDYYGSIHENVTAGTSILQVAATDADTPAETTLTYHFEAGHSDQHFTLDETTGILRTSTTLDRESIANYTIEVRANDGEHNSMPNAFIHVSILDINDEIPMFTKAQYHFSIGEGNQEIQYVGQVVATSLETGLNGKHLYYKNKLPIVPFNLDNVTGHITTTMVLDREMMDEYSFKVRVEDAAPPPHFATADVTITVTDVNDNPPTFTPDFIQLELPERTAVGSTVHVAEAVDIDLPPHNTANYSFSGSSTGFSINHETGSITLESSLDYDTAPNIVLTVLARDAQISQYTGILTINITVTPEPDTVITFPPWFPTEYHIPEDAPLNTPLIEFYAQDHNGHQVPNVNYHLMNIMAGQDNPFGVTVSSQNSNATISTVGLLNRENQATYVLNVTITSTETPSNRVTQILTVHLIDINDNHPSFSVPSYTFFTPEDLPQGEEIGNLITASDPDFGINGTIFYYLKHPSTIFNVSQHSNPDGSIQSGSLYLIGSLNREAQNAYVLTVVASDKGNPAMTAEVPVIINVTDVNDNDPSFTPHVIHIEETVPVGFTNMELQGIDDDEGSNGEVEFFHQPKSTATSKFRLYQNGTIEVIDLLDFEEKQDYIFFITVRDKGSPTRSTTGNVTIRVININDHSPVFTQSLEELTVPINESFQINKDIINVTASDKDDGAAGVVLYELANIADSELFFLSTEGTLQLRSNLDYEKRAQHHVGIIAFDQGMPRNRISNTTVIINVENINEEPPKFDQVLFSVSIAENQPINTFIATIRARDADFDDITYSLTDNERFTYNPMTGSLSSNVIFDHETAPVHNFMITASDGQMEGKAVIRVYVENLNDNPPVFKPSSYVSQVPESVHIGTTILCVHAEDRDNMTNKAVRYFLSGGNAENAFSIGEYSGSISVNGALNFENRQQYTLSVMAEDLGSPPSSGQATVMITVTNVNEFSPQFTQNVYNFSITEESPKGAKVGKVTAEDGDDGSFGNVLYSFQGNSDYFSIDAQTGVIRVVLPIDRETVPMPPLLTVVATDGERSTTATVRITLQDINDNGPIFPTNLYKFNVNATINALAKFDRVHATDSDIGANSVTDYSLVSTPMGLPLAINPSSGDLFLTSALPSDFQYSYKATVMAVDSQNSAFSDQTTVEIFIVEENNHPPSFSQDSYNITLVENSSPSNPIITTAAMDPDTGSNGVLTYSLAESNVPFTIDTGNGSISLTHVLDYEAASEYNLTVVVQDHTPNNPRSASAQVHILVTNVNDNAPMLSNSALTISPVPYTGVGLFQADASDPDGSTLSYDLNSYTDRFAIDSQTGLVTNKMTLTAGTSYGLNIVAMDGFNPSVTATITVTVTDPVSAAPSFSSPGPVELSFPEQTSPFSIINITATGSSPISYNLVKVSPSTDIFSLDLVTGALRTVGPLDYEEHTAYQLVVEARSGSDTNRHSRFLQIQLTVINVNEFKPTFTMETIETSIHENIVGEVSVANVHADDHDEGTYGQIQYTISDNGGVFMIGLTSGAITKPAGVLLDRETTATYTLTVTATDTGGSGMSATATVIVNVEDENDSPPVLPQDYAISVMEPGSVGDVIIRIQATDPDTHSSFAYSLGQVNSFLGNTSKGSAPNTFAINSTTGEILLDVLLDRETVDRYIVAASVIDGIHTSTTYITVTIQDANDNPPVFNIPVLNINIEEQSSVDTELKPGNGLESAMRASDMDTGLNSIVRYSVNGLQSWFTIDPISGVIRVSQTFSYEDFHGSHCNMTGPELIGMVEATDGVHTAVLTLRVTVIEINNHLPVFERSPYHLKVTETADTGQSLMNVPIRVTDSDCGTNAAFTTGIPNYYFAATSLFRWDEEQDSGYQLKVNSALQQGIYHFRVEAYNLDPRPRRPELFLASYAHFTVEVLPQNVYSPVLNSSQYAATVLEDVQNNTPVVWTHATDNDRGKSGEVAYSLSSTEDHLPFAVDNTSGVIYTTGQLDRETTPSYSFQLVAADHGFPVKKNSTTVFITVGDVNDLAPVFNPPTFQGSVIENTDLGTSVLRVFAEDDDLYSGGKVEYSLQSSIPLPFVIDNVTGVVSTSGSIDFEQQSEYRFQVNAHDLGTPSLSNITQVVVKVIGVDETAPEFDRNNPTMFAVSLDASKGDVIGVVRASDADAGEDGKVYFFLESVSRDNAINLRNGSNNTGEIILATDPVSASETRRALKARQLDDESVMVSATIAIAPAKGDSPRITATFSVLFPSGFFPLPTATATPTLPSSALIAIFSVVAGVGVLAAVMVLVCFAVVLRRKSKGKRKHDITHPNNIAAPQRTDTESNRYLNRHEVVEMTSTSIPRTQRRGQGNSASPEDGEELDTADLATPCTSSNQLQRNRSTSDLASTVATDALTQDTAISFTTYNKAQIEAIYAANASLLHDGSQASVHSFNSEGGGEADGNDLDNMLFVKYDLDTEGSVTHIDDDLSYDDKDRQSYSDSSGGREEYHFTQSTNMWSSRPGSLARSITEMSTPGETRAAMYHSAMYDPSQGVSGYGYSTQGSNVSLLRHHHRYGHSEHDLHLQQHQVYDDDYFPEADAHAPYAADIYSRSHPHSRTPVLPHQYETGGMDYHPVGTRSYQYSDTPDSLLPPSHPPLSHYNPPPPPYYSARGEGSTAQHLLRTTYEPMLSSSSTSLSTNASHPLPRHAPYNHMEGYHPN